MIQRYTSAEDQKKITRILDKISIFGGFTKEQYNRIFNFLEKLTFEENEIIFHKGDNPNYIYIIIEGNVKIIQELKGENLEIILFSQGQCFGETSIIGIQPHTASALASTATECIALSRKSLMQIFTEDKDLFSLLILNIAREACRRLYKTDEILLNYLSHKYK